MLQLFYASSGSFLSFDNGLFMLWLGLSTEITLNIVFGLKYLFWSQINTSVTKNTAKNCPEDSFKLLNGVTITNVEMQCWTAVTGLAAFSPVTSPPAPDVNK